MTNRKELLNTIARCELLKYKLFTSNKMKSFNKIVKMSTSFHKKLELLLSKGEAIHYSNYGVILISTSKTKDKNLRYEFIERSDEYAFIQK